MDIGQLRNGLGRQGRPQIIPSRKVMMVVAGVAAALLLAVTGWQVAGSMGRHEAPQSAQATPLAQDQIDAGRGPIGAPLLWKVSGKNSTIYLFGSLHYLRSNMDWMDRRLFQAFDSSQEAWFELAEIDTPRSLDLHRSSYLAARPVLTTGLSDTEKQELTTILNRYNMTLDDVARVKPMVMAAALREFDVMAGGFQVDRGADYTLFKRARNMKKPVKGLETYHDHYAYAANLDPAAQRGDGTKALKQALAAHFGTGPVEDIHVLARYWKSGDQRAITAMIARDYQDEPELNAILLTERNGNWMPKLEAMIAGNGTVFVTVGEAHLVGPDGLVARLRARGYRVERVDP
ncbi:MAG: TraB/GumN family protein [Asticcacaulis sp.]|nr:TraB/GumN family protein [Asticcacaulis sp.]